MTQPWFRVYEEILDDPKVQKLPPDLFRACFMQAIHGEGGPFEPHIRLGRDRPSGPTWVKLRAETFARDDYTCRYCGERGGRLECDHIQPVSRGGSNDPENLATSCFDCNRAKRDKTVEEWMAGHG